MTGAVCRRYTTNVGIIQLLWVEWPPVTIDNLESEVGVFLSGSSFLTILRTGFISAIQSHLSETLIVVNDRIAETENAQAKIDELSFGSRTGSRKPRTVEHAIREGGETPWELPLWQNVR